MAEGGPSRGMQRRAARSAMYAGATDGVILPGGGGGGALSGASRSRGPQSAANFVCQKCYALGHWTYECKAVERAFLARPSRSAVLHGDSSLRQQRAGPVLPPPEALSGPSFLFRRVAEPAAVNAAIASANASQQQPLPQQQDPAPAATSSGVVAATEAAPIVLEGGAALEASAAARAAREARKRARSRSPSYSSYYSYSYSGYSSYTYSSTGRSRSASPRREPESDAARGRQKGSRASSGSEQRGVRRSLSRSRSRSRRDK